MADYYSVIAHAVSRLPNKTDEAKQAIYERARAALRKALRSPFSETELVAEQAALEVAISMVEAIQRYRDAAGQLRRIAANIAKVPPLLGRKG